MKKGLLFSLASVCAFAVANIYYNQPLLVLIAHTFHIDAADASVLSSIVQIFYAVGLVLFVPLGDRISPRKIIIIILLLNALSQVVAAVSVQFTSLIIATAFIGVTSIAAQIIIPAVSIMSTPETKAKNVSTVMTGLFAGILFARVLSGFVGHYVGWQMVYWMSACVDVLLAVMIFIMLPTTNVGSKLPYSKLLTSLYTLFTSKKTLRYACFSGFLMFAVFSALWGSLAYLLSKPPYFYTSNIVGLFGLAGIPSILASRYIGFLANKMGGRRVIVIAALVALIAFALLWFSPLNILPLVLGIVILDLAGRAGLISNQLRLFNLSANMRSRLNTIFMSIYFLGGAIGTKLGAEITHSYGWYGLSLLGIITAIIIAVFNMYVHDDVEPHITSDV